jgi:hypothetical protein
MSRILCEIGEINVVCWGTVSFCKVLHLIQISTSPTQSFQEVFNSVVKRLFIINFNGRIGV